MATGRFSALPNTRIEQHVGRASFERGRDYAERGMVRQVTFVMVKAGEVATMDGMVRGSGSRPYDVWLALECKDGLWRLDDSDCSCPVGNACKHVAALALAGRQELDDSLASSQLMQPADQAPPALWEKSLAKLLPDAKQAPTYTPLALLFEPITISRYNYPDYYQLPEGWPKPKLAIGIRLASVSPVSGRWVMSDISWRRLRSYHPQFDPAQLEFLLEIWNLYSIRLGGYYDEKYLFLDSFHSPQFGSLLVQGQRLGIKYLNHGGDRPPVVVLNQSATVVIDAAADEVGALTLEPHIELDGHRVPSEQLGFIGRPAHAVYVWHGKAGPTNNSLSPLLLAPLAEPLTLESQKSLLKAEIWSVPAAEVPRFTRIYYPKLARQFQVVAKGEVDLSLPKLEPPSLVLRLAVRQPRSLEVNWHWRYSYAGESFELPLYDINHDAVKRETESEPVERDRQHEQSQLATVGDICSSTRELFQPEPAAAGRVSAITTGLMPTAKLDGMAMVVFADQALPKLQQLSGVEVLQTGDLPMFEESSEAPTVELGLEQSDGGGVDWFDLSVAVKLGDEEVPFETLFAALADNEPYMLLASGTYFKLNHPDLEKLRQLIVEARGLQDSPSGELRLSPYQASLWDELRALGVISSQAAAWQASIEGLLNLRQIPKVAVPAKLQATLRPYQKQGFQWLAFLWRHKLGGILADDMGLGKTLQAIALLLHVKAATAAKDRAPVLIIAPTSVAANWAAELERFAPSLNSLYVRQKFSAQNLSSQDIQQADVIISTYGLFRLNVDGYAAHRWSMLILDEAQFVKNHQSKGYQAVRKLAVPFKLALSGTPMENNLMELWSLLSIAAPGLFPSPTRFNDLYRQPIEKDGDREALQRLRRRVKPLMLRRTKEQVVKELPPKIEQTIEMELLPEHNKVYQTYLQRERQRVLGLLGDMNKNRFMIFKALTTLRLLSLDPKMVDAKKYARIPSTKLNGLFEQLEAVLQEGHRALIFSQFTKFLTTVRAELDARNIPYLYLDGATKNRAALLKQFKDPASKIPLFLISMKAGGFGLNLTEADYCFILDPWWNPAVEQQAVDRTHRIGQSKQVMVYRFIAKGTIEEKVMALKARKAKLFASMMDDEATFSSAITADDIRALFDE